VRELRNIKLVIEYDGTNYSGWQRQNNALTVQECIENAIYSITKERVDTIGCSRTDAGVHAREFVLNFKINSSIEEKKIKNALNAFLPDDIIVTQAYVVDDDFHARYHCKGKMYSYTVYTRREGTALFRNYSYTFKKKLDLDKMIRASKCFIGTHDFSSFRNLGSSAKTAERTITDFRIEQNGDMIKFYIAADGFLYNMVRIIVGTLIDIGIGRREENYINYLMEIKDRSKAGKSVPPQGLCLEEVFY
jgi:tRNA pseudouridine38-40 synthase